MSEMIDFYLRDAVLARYVQWLCGIFRLCNLCSNSCSS